MKKIAFAGTDGRTLLSALVTGTATSDIYDDVFKGVVIRGTPSMPKFSEIMHWSVEYIATKSNSVEDYTAAIIEALTEKKIDYVIPMPEALLFEGLVDAVEHAGFGDHIIGLKKSGAFIEGDKIKCKKLCREAGIPVATAWNAGRRQRLSEHIADLFKLYPCLWGRRIEISLQRRRQRRSHHFELVGNQRRLRWIDQRLQSRL